MMANDNPCWVTPKTTRARGEAPSPAAPTQRLRRPKSWSVAVIQVVYPRCPAVASTGHTRRISSLAGKWVN
jgi:hypothetical protein